MESCVARPFQIGPGYMRLVGRCVVSVCAYVCLCVCVCVCVCVCLCVCDLNGRYQPQSISDP